MLPKRIVAIGTSSLFGRVDPQGGGYIGRLKSWHEQQAAHNAVFNLGISGETTTQMLARFEQELTPRKPDLILVNTGSNDTRHRGTIAAPRDIPLITSLENLQSMIVIGRKLAPIVFISIYPILDAETQPLMDTDYFYLQKDIAELAQATKRVCNENHLPYLNIFDEWNEREYPPYIHADGLHANEVGHQKIFEMLKEFLQEIYA